MEVTLSGDGSHERGHVVFRGTGSLRYRLRQKQNDAIKVGNADLFYSVGQELQKAKDELMKFRQYQANLKKRFEGNK